MKTKSVILASVLTSLLVATSCKNDESLIPESTKSVQTRSVVPDTFDWENADWLPTPEGQSRIPTPWVGQGSLASTWGLEILEDRHKRHGWELLYSTFTKDASGSLLNPYFILYNKYRGLMRIFFYTTTPFVTTSSYIQDGLSIISNTQTRLLDFMVSDCIDPSRHTSSYKQIQSDGSQPLATNKWYMMQYELAYDPNITNIPYNQIQLSWNLNFYNVTDFTFGGEIEAKINGTIGEAGGSNWLSSVNQAGQHIGTGLLAGVGLSIWDKNTVGTDGSNKFGLSKTLFNSVSKGLQSAVSAMSSGIFGDVIKIASGVFGPKQITPMPISLNLFGNIKLNGSSTNSGSFPSMPISFWMPGTSIPQTAVGYIPLYNKSLGVVNFNGTPTIRIDVSESIEKVNDDSYPGGSILTITHHYARIHPFNDFTKYLIVNPEVKKIAEVRIVQQEILQKVADNNYIKCPEAYEETIYDTPYIQSTMFDKDMQFVARFVIEVAPKDGEDPSYIVKTLKLDDYWIYDY